MQLSDFDYELPPERIARVPAQERDLARLLVHQIDADCTRHMRVRDLPELLKPGDLLVFNDTRVRRARLHGQRASGAAVEFLLHEREPGAEPRWRALAKPAKRLRAGEHIELLRGDARSGERLRLIERTASGDWRLELLLGPGVLEQAWIERLGELPLPPYLERSGARGAQERALDQERYQTVFARELGAVATPTAGLHFTTELLERVQAQGAELAFVTLHVGLGTFQPVQEEDVRQHRMHREQLFIPEATVEAVARTRQRGGRLLAIGTTACRALESAVTESGRLQAGWHSSELFLLPGSRFALTDALLTNFHLPRSTLLMLVSAFAGRERSLRLYREALALQYRFFSYGDAMLLLRETGAGLERGSDALRGAVTLPRTGSGAVGALDPIGPGPS